jgi:hypothetical protein
MIPITTHTQGSGARIVTSIGKPVCCIDIVVDNRLWTPPAADVSVYYKTSFDPDVKKEQMSTTNLHLEPGDVVDLIADMSFGYVFRDNKHKMYYNLHPEWMLIFGMYKNNVFVPRSVGQKAKYERWLENPEAYQLTL